MVALSGRNPGLVRRAAGTLAALGLVVLTAPSAAGDPASRLAAATARLHALETRIGDEQAAVAHLQSTVRGLAGELWKSERSYGSVQDRLMRTRALLAEVRATYDGLREAIDARAREVYMQGPATGIEAILGSTSITDLRDRIEFLSGLNQAQADLATQAEDAEARLRTHEAGQEAMLAQRAGIERGLVRQQSSLAAKFALAQGRMDDLVRDRTRLATLIRTLRGRLRSQEMATARSMLSPGMPISYGRWAGLFLTAIGAPRSRSNVVVMVAWETAEGTAARWNPLATTYDIAGATAFNSVGVKNYASLSMGLQAAEGTLENSGHGYEQILASLRASAAAEVTAQAINASDWCRGCSGGAYVTELIPAVEAYFARYAGA